MRPRLSKVIVLSAIFALAGCAITGTEPAERSLWTMRRPASYQFTMSMSCFCVVDVTRPVIVTVVGTTVTSRIYADNGAPVPAQLTSAFPSIDGLFDILQQARNKHAQHADATYDVTLGFPLTISLDYSEQVADDETWYSIGNFKAQ